MLYLLGARQERTKRAACTAQKAAEDDRWRVARYRRGKARALLLQMMPRCNRGARLLLF